MSYSFIKVTLVPNTQGPAAYSSKDVLVSVSSILFISKRVDDYEIVLTNECFQALQKRHYGANTTIKEVTAKIKDEQIFSIS